MKHYLILLLFLLPFSAFAQYTDTTTRMLAYTTTGSINSTQDGRAYLLNNGLRFGLRKKAISLNTSHTWLYGKQNNNLTNNDYSAVLDFNVYKPWPRFYYWGLANYNTSFSLKIRNQLLTGAGIAYSFLDNPNAYLNLSNGLLYDRSDLIVDTLNQSYQSIRNSFRLQFRFGSSELVTLTGSGFYQPSLRFRNDHIIRSSVTLSLRLRRWLNINSALNYNKVSRTGRENLLFSYGLGFRKILLIRILQGSGLTG